MYENVVPVPRPEGHDDVYPESIHTLNDYFHVAGNVAYERHVLRWLEQDLDEDGDSCLVRLKRQARQYRYYAEELDASVRDQLLEVSSQELGTKLFEVPNIQLQEAITKARAWEMARCLLFFFG